MASATQHFDAVVIGAGFSGMYMLKSLRDKVEAHMDELNEHLKLIYYKIELYQKIAMEEELEKA